MDNDLTGLQAEVLSSQSGQRGRAYRHAGRTVWGFRQLAPIIPASGFYEWTGAKGAKQPHLFTAADGSPLLAFAGLWDRWKDPATSEWILSCTIIVSGASAWMEPYHDRMPVLLEAKDFDGWLDGSLGPEELKPAPEEALREWKVSPRLNRTGVGDDDPTIIEPDKAA